MNTVLIGFSGGIVETDKEPCELAWDRLTEYKVECARCLEPLKVQVLYDSVISVEPHKCSKDGG